MGAPLTYFHIMEIWKWEKKRWARLPNAVGVKASGSIPACSLEEAHVRAALGRVRDAGSRREDGDAPPPDKLGRHSILPLLIYIYCAFGQMTSSPPDHTRK
jgi:hypothetical protein